MRIIGLVRVSSDEQANEGVSLAAQEAKVRAFAALHDLNLVEVIIEAGESAKTIKRPGLQRALAMLRRGDADGLVVAKLDRLSRSVRDWNDLIDGYFGEKAARSLMSVAESIDTRTAAGRMVLNIMMTVAQWEREAIAERTRDALRHKKSRGERTGGVPFGFALDASDARRSKDGLPIALVENPREQETIAKVVELRGRGLSCRAIATEMNERGIKAKGNGRWHETTVRRILAQTA
jgi:site-specific DNA recombinase